MPVHRPVDAAALLCCALLLAGTASGEAADHVNFDMRNDSPFASIIGVPGRWPDDSARQLDISFNVSSHSISRRGAEEFVLIDGETHRVQLRYQQALHERVKFGVSVPWISHTGGFMDGTIDTWHDLTGLREGIRPSRPRDTLLYSYGREVFEIFGIDSSKSGLGDTRLGLSIDLQQPGDADRGRFGALPIQLVLTAELPTGDLERLTGNDHTDYAMGLRISSAPRADRRLLWSADAGIVWPGDVDIAGLPTRDRVFYYDVAIGWRWLRNLDLLVDVAGNGALYESELKNLGKPAAQIAAGIVWHVSAASRLRLGFYEDLLAESATDFGIEIALTLGAF